MHGAVLVLLALVTVGCASPRDERTPAALYKKPTLGGGAWDRVAIVDGMTDNMAMCVRIVEGLKATHVETELAGDEFSCGPVR